MKAALFPLLFFCLAGLSAADTRVMRAARTDIPPVIDGRLDEECWKKASGSGPFTRFNTVAEQASPQTEAYALHDDKNLYFGVKCVEPRMEKLRLAKALSQHAPETLRGAMFYESIRKSSGFEYSHGENIEIFLSPGLGKDRYAQFIVNTSGGMRARFQTGDPMHLGELPWDAAVFFGGDFFSVEVAIPFAVLHLPPAPPKEWGLNICRAIMLDSCPAEMRNSLWSPGKTAFGNTECFGKLLLADANFAPFGMRVKMDTQGKEAVLEVVAEKELKARADVRVTSQQGKSRNVSMDIDLVGGGSKKISPGSLGDEDNGALVELRLTDSRTGAIIYEGATQTVDATSFAPPRTCGPPPPDNVVIDYFTSGSVKDWHAASKYWEDNKPNAVPVGEEVASLEFSDDKDYFTEGGGSMKLCFPGGLLAKYPLKHVVVSRNFSPENMEKCDALSFWIYNRSGGGRIDIRLFDNKNWSSNIMLGSVFLGKPGLRRHVLKPVLPAKAEQWRKFNCVAFVCFGDFTAHLSGIRMISKDRDGGMEAKWPPSSMETEEIPTSDETLPVSRQ